MKGRNMKKEEKETHINKQKVTTMKTRKRENNAKKRNTF